MVHGIVEDVQQDRLDRVKHMPVQFNFLPRDVEMDFFFQVARQIAHGSFKLVRDDRQRQQA